jgi:MoaA/NifB/PqqE/SkfB family radical SAM enzyme
MSRDTARRAVDVLLASTESGLELDLWGGEPLLEMPLIRRIVEYVEARVPAGKTVAFSISTNGVLLDDGIVRFLAQHRIETQLSFDGVPAAQLHRGRSSFGPIDQALRSWRKRHPESFRNLLSIAITVHPGNVAALPESVRYFLELGVRDVSMAPILTHASGWEPGDIGALERRFEQILEASVTHYRETGEIPLTMFRGARAARPPARFRNDGPAATLPDPGALCGAASPTKLVVDADGSIHGCVTFVDSYQRWSTPFLRESLEPLRLGPLSDPGLDRRLAAFPAALERSGLFHGRERKYSSYGRCAECPLRERCCICPVSIAHVPGNADPHRMPDFPCAFQRVTGEHRKRFEERVRALEILRGYARRRAQRVSLLPEA